MAPSPQSRPEASWTLHTELLRIAHRLFQGEPVDHTLTPTALVNEAWLKFARQPDFGAGFENDPTVMRRIAAKLMRRMLIDHARKRNANKRGARYRVALDPGTVLGADQGSELDTVDLLSLDEALNALARSDPRGARAVELRVFAGLTLADLATTLHVSISQAKRVFDDAVARLRRELTRE